MALCGKRKSKSWIRGVFSDISSGSKLFSVLVDKKTIPNSKFLKNHAR